MSKWKISADARVNDYLNDFVETFPESYEIIQTVRAIITDLFPQAQESIKYGGVVYFDEDDLFTGIFARKKHVSLEFVNGVDLKDPRRLLEGTGKLRRHLKLKSLEDITRKEVREFLQQYS